jgi:hypothetical protein
MWPRASVKKCTWADQLSRLIVPGASPGLAPAILRNSWRYLIAAFKDYTIKRALAGAILLFLSTKKTKLPITKDILDKIVTFSPYKADINVDTVFTIAFTGFLRIGEITYLNRKAKDFSTTRALRSDIRIAPNGYLIVFYLKRSKIDKTHSGVDI